jgi:hypothetical protein
MGRGRVKAISREVEVQTRCPECGLEVKGTFSVKSQSLDYEIQEAGKLCRYLLDPEASWDPMKCVKLAPEIERIRKTAQTIHLPR